MRPRWNVQCRGTLQSQHEGLGNDLVIHARVSPGDPDIEVWEEANAGAKKACHRSDDHQNTLKRDYYVNVQFQDLLTQVTERLWKEDDKYGQQTKQYIQPCSSSQLCITTAASSQVKNKRKSREIAIW
ncbi:hypothetical protein B0H14DRAFT_2573238 [Mycena olivaceomarginata]|nr:hypothetical protein B0H14DRAFT_2573238 [Mycena olivaceomarginata]